MAGYSLTTFGQLVTALSLRLADPNFYFWTQAELQSYISEALQTWQAHSQFYSVKAQIVTTPGTLLYNLATMLPALTPSVTDQSLVQQIQRHLQEPVNPSGWSGSEQFTFSAVVSAIQKRRDQFILETGLAQTISEFPAAPSPVGFYELDDTVMQVRRAMWKNRSGIYSLLWRADEFVFTGSNPGWFNAAALPTDYSTVLQQPLGLQLSPPPLDAGSLNLITVNSGAFLNPANGPTVLGIPDDFVWVVKYGALADLFGQNGPGMDPGRADYCLSRWRDGIELARITNFVKLGYQNGVPAFIDSMEELDTTSPGWVSGTPGSPQGMAVSGNIVAVNPIADAGPYSLLFDLTPKMILPIAPSDFVQIGQEYLDAILDYSLHLAMLKEGVSELSASLPFFKNFVALAAVENDVLRANSNNFDVLSDRTLREAHDRPRRKSDITLSELSGV